MGGNTETQASCLSGSEPLLLGPASSFTKQHVLAFLLALIKLLATYSTTVSQMISPLWGTQELKLWLG